MSSFSSSSLRKPKDWQDFERKIAKLFSCVLDDPNTQMHGRSGQEQHGVDVWGYRNRDTNKLVGVQCKRSSDKITAVELVEEFEKARKFTPPISEFFLVTTAPRDAKIQKKALELTNAHSQTSRPIKVVVWGWEDIEEHAANHAEALEAFDPTYNPFAKRAHQEILVKLETLGHQADRIEAATKADRAPASAIGAELTDEKTALHGQITAYQHLIDDGNVRVALQRLNQLKDKNWPSASPTERYRLLVAMGAAKLRLGEYEEAGHLLLQAFEECPTHRTSALNRAKGWLLTNEAASAAEQARALLKEEPLSADAASILIQARIEETSGHDPLFGIAEALHEAPEVLVARIHYLRCRENGEWVALAEHAAELHPADSMLRQFSAEAVLERATKEYADAMAGASLPNGAWQRIKDASEILYGYALDAIEKDYPLPVSLAHNAALALRIAGNDTHAKQILDAGIRQHPADKDLRFQRAIFAHSDGDPAGVLALLANEPDNAEATALMAEALLANGRADEALKILDSIVLDGCPQHVRRGVAGVRAWSCAKLGNIDAALAILSDQVGSTPADIALRAMQLRIVRQLRGIDTAQTLLEGTLTAVSDDTSLRARVELAHEARRLGRDDAAIRLLDGRVATDRANEALSELLAAALNGNYPKKAREILDSLDATLKEEPAFRRAAAVLALNTGDPAADVLIGRYLDLRPNDLEIILARMGVWQRLGRENEIEKYLRELPTPPTSEKPALLMRLAVLIARYVDAKRALKLAYAALLAHWGTAEAHLSYHGLILLNKEVEKAIPAVDRVDVDCVIGLAAEGEGEVRRYRIEAERHPAFDDERIPPDHELARLMKGKKVGEEIIPRDRIGALPLRIKWIRHVAVDALHESMNSFNERFPRSDGLLKFSTDLHAEDPFRDIREITKARAEADTQALDTYEAQNIPLAFLASMIGHDPVDAWAGLPSVGRDFKVCRGIAPERTEARRMLLRRPRTGCVVDAITLSVVRRLRVAEAVAAVCGPISTTQSVIDLLAYREAMAEYSVGKRQGFLAWRNGRLTFDQYSEATLKQEAEERKAEHDWVKVNCGVVAAVPREDLDAEQRKLVALFDRYATDPAVAAQGNDLLLLSEDLGYRLWAREALGVSTTWLQPVLMIARAEGHLTSAEYSEAINLLALSRHNYISLDVAALLHQITKDNYEPSDQFNFLLRGLGGRIADISANSIVAAGFLDQLIARRVERTAILRCAGAVFSAITAGRNESPHQIVPLIVEQLRVGKDEIVDYALQWMIGHSIGTDKFDELLAIQERARARGLLRSDLPTL